MSLRSVRHEDAVPLTRLLRRCLDLDHVFEGLIREKVWDDPDFCAELALTADDGSGGLAGFIMGVCRSGNRGYIKLMAVAPEARGSGLGTRLLDAAETGLAGMGVTEVRLGESAPNYLWPGVDPRYTHAMLFFENRGYRRIGETYNLDVTLGEKAFNPPSHLALPNGEHVIFRRASAIDRPELDRFLDGHWSAWKPELDRGWRCRPRPIHLANRGNELLGFAAYDCNNVGTGWFGPMATAHDWRGRGIGRALLFHCLEDLRNRGLSRAVIPWVGPVGFYCRTVDARVARVFFRYEKSLK